MAVEASHLNLFPPQLISNRYVNVTYPFLHYYPYYTLYSFCSKVLIFVAYICREMKNPMDANINLYNTQMGYSSIHPFSGTAVTESLLRPPYNTLIGSDSFPQKTAMKSDNSSLTCNVPLSRKRSRDNNVNSINNYHHPSGCGSFSFLGEDISLQIQQQQLDIDHLISQRVSPTTQLK